MHEYCAAMIMMVRMEAPSQTLSVMSDKLQNVSRQTLEGLKQTTFLYNTYTLCPQLWNAWISRATFLSDPSGLTH